MKVVQELMRHANITTTTSSVETFLSIRCVSVLARKSTLGDVMNIYTHALTPAKRRAQSKAVDVLFDRTSQQVVLQ